MSLASCSSRSRHAASPNGSRGTSAVMRSTMRSMSAALVSMYVYRDIGAIPSRSATLRIETASIPSESAMATAVSTI